MPAAEMIKSVDSNTNLKIGFQASMNTRVDIFVTESQANDHAFALGLKTDLGYGNWLSTQLSQPMMEILHLNIIYAAT